MFTGKMRCSGLFVQLPDFSQWVEKNRKCVCGVVKMDFQNPESLRFKALEYFFKVTSAVCRIGEKNCHPGESLNYSRNAQNRCVVSYMLTFLYLELFCILTVSLLVAVGHKISFPNTRH